MTQPDWEKFGRSIMKMWPDGGVDGFELQDLAIESSIILEAKNGYDPERHGHESATEYDLEKGDTYYERNYWRE
ncbi:MAG: hypothetical protein GY749_22670 [Desulfobacteraceae bacterium]|nr:hypothetical protein [Desulfobacteraceae bacterium]